MEVDITKANLKINTFMALGYSWSIPKQMIKMLFIIKEISKVVFDGATEDVYILKVISMKACERRTNSAGRAPMWGLTKRS